jgi:putative DNA primase/helicase
MPSVPRLSTRPTALVGAWTSTGIAKAQTLDCGPLLTQWPDRDDTKRIEAAIAIWQAMIPARSTLFETYHAGLVHPPGGLWPAIVALVRHWCS